MSILRHFFSTFLLRDFSGYLAKFSPSKAGPFHGRCVLGHGSKSVESTRWAVLPYGGVDLPKNLAKITFLKNQFWFFFFLGRFSVYLAKFSKIGGYYHGSKSVESTRWAVLPYGGVDLPKNLAKITFLKNQFWFFFFLGRFSVYLAKFSKNRWLLPWL